MIEREIRAVLDTNVVVAALLSKNPASPTAELIRRWRKDEFKLLYSQHIREEYAEKLLARKADPSLTASLLSDVDRRGIHVLLGMHHRFLEVSPQTLPLLKIESHPR